MDKIYILKIHIIDKIIYICSREYFCNFIIYPNNYMEGILESNILMPKRRRIANPEACKSDLKAELCTLFNLYKEACSLYEKEIVKTPPDARLRGFEARLMNIKLVQCVQKYFPSNWKIGKHGRFILRINGYIVLFKKLNRNNMPMHIDSKVYQAIENQMQGTLFARNDDFFEPILFFGYQKDKFGELKDPKLVYIDEFKVKWEITSNDVILKRQVENMDTVTMPNNNSMSIKPNVIGRRAINE